MLNKSERDELKSKARKAYKSGSTYAQISEALGGISKSTISGWCSDLASKRLHESMAVTSKRRQLSAEAKSKSKPEQKGKAASAPYLGWTYYLSDRGDGRTRIHLVKTKPKRKDRYMLLAKYLLEVKLGRKLKGDETVDHIDEDKSNDKPKNLQVLSRQANIEKHRKHIDPSFYEPRVCVICESEFSYRQKRRETCSEECKLTLMSLSHKYD